MKLNLKEHILKKYGFNVNYTQYIIAICNGYQVISELLKKYLLVIVYFDPIIYEIKSNDQKIKKRIEKGEEKILKIKKDIEVKTPKNTLGQLNNILKNNLINGEEGKCKKNKFIDNLSVKTRNSIAHLYLLFRK
jgi:hypothetical protein